MSEKRILRVGDVAVSDLHTIDRFATVAEAVALMRRHRISSLVVNRRDEDDEPGLVTVTDVARKVIAGNRALERVNVYEIMSKPVLALPSDMQARYAVRLLVRLDISRAVVVDQNRNPVGIATLRDLVLGHVQE